MSRAKIISVDIERTESGLFRATSPELLGLHVAGPSIEDLKTSARLMIEDLFAAKGMKVAVYEAEDNDPSVPPPWVIVPSSSEIPAH